MDYSKFIRKRMMNLGVSYYDASRVGSWYIQQISSRGKAGAVDYIKRVGDTILWYLYGSPQKPSWVATKHRFPKALYFLKKYDRAVLERVAKIARAVTLDELHSKQVQKVVRGATDPYSGSESGLAWLSEIINLGLAAAQFSVNPGVQPVDPKLITRTFRKVMSLSGKTDTTLEPPVKESLDIVIKVPALYNLPYWKEAFYPLHPEWLEDYFERYIGPEGHAVGEIHAAQEGGAKLRMYASPYSIVQNLLYPIHYWVDTFRRQLPTDCTYDQKSGAEWAQSVLRRGEQVFSVDLSTATCRFPLCVQIDMLRNLGLAVPYCDALVWASQGEWKVGSELLPDFPESMSWVVGQPLGIAPSMSMFSLAHNLLLIGCCDLLGLDPAQSFRVLGDDVVLRTTALHELYTRVIGLAGVPISWHKCHSSDKVAEFAGFTISSGSLMRAGQWREAGVSNHLSLAEDLGSPLKGEVSLGWVEAEKLHLFMMAKYSPPIQEWSKYLRLSSEIRECLELTPPDATDGLPWSHGIRRLLNKQFDGHTLRLLPTSFDEVDVIYRGLPCTESIRYWKYMSSWFDNTSTDQILVEAWTGLHQSYQLGEIDRKEYVLMLDRLKSNTHSLYWRVPPRKGDGSQLHKRLMAALA